MGAKGSKPSFIAYEDAVKRVPDSELRRIREAFKRCAGANGTTLSLEAFVHEVLSDGVPFEVAEWLFQACGGTKRGLAFRDLLCGLVVLTKGNLEEKIKFLWTLYVNNSSDNGTYIYKRDFSRALHLENTTLPVTEVHKSAEILTSLFGLGDRVTFEQFRSWLLIRKDATVLSKWLLSDRTRVAQDLETPTFYQSLAGVTHLEERDIIELEKCFWSLRNSAPTGQLDAESLTPLLSPPLPRAAVAGVFLAFDENRDGHIDFKELCCGLSAACRGPRTERLKFCFKIFDLDRDRVLNKKELIDMVGILCSVANESLKNNSRASTPSDGPESEGTDKGFDPDSVLVNLREKMVTAPRQRPVFQLGPGGESEVKVTAEETPVQDPDTDSIIPEDTALPLEDFLIWSVENAGALVTPFLELVMEVCHIVLGLRPQCRHQERDVVLGWLRREVSRGYSVGQFWYLIGAEWWNSWSAYCASQPNAACCRDTRSVPIDEACVCDDSFTTNSTESMGSLLWRAETASLGSAGSSSGVSSAPTGRQNNHPGPIDNKRLLAPNHLKVRTLTGEGGHLRRDITLAQHRDFELVPDALWRALALWYGGADPLPRQVIRPPNSDVELELYPLHLKLLRHVTSPHRLSTVAAVGGATVSLYSSVPAPPERQLAYTAAFSRLATVKQVSEFLCQALGLAREDMRLWLLGSTNVLLDDERPTLTELGLDERSRLLVEVRNADLTWPEEIHALSMSGGTGGNRASARRETLSAPNLPGATGLHNLGNTCFMNAALQAVWNTAPLTKYFNSGIHLYELNSVNPLGTKGALAMRYGELCKEVWSCSARSVAPLRVRWCVSRYARHLAHGQQHDAQELLAWLLDTLHEDLNRVSQTQPLRETQDSDGRPDQVVAQEAWESFTCRNQSIMTDLFYGQLKSKVTCTACGHESVRFDTFNMLSLPLPMESYVRAELKVMLLDGSVPVKYGVRVNSEGTCLDLKNKLSELCGLPPHLMLLVELSGATIGRVLEDKTRIATVAVAALCVYEIPSVDEEDSSDGECDSACAWEAGVAGSPEVSAPQPSLCMPALFCFKRSRSETVMSQSPPNTFHTNHESRSHTLPRDLSDLKRTDANGNSSPTLSVKSLNLKPTSQPLNHVKFNSSPSNMDRMNDAPTKIQYLVAVHRKQCRSDAYFLPSQRCAPALFGVPILVGIRRGMSGQQLYAEVWQQVSRLLSARPAPAQHAPPNNHAHDCDDSLGYEFPFTLRLVSSSGAWCGACSWDALCRGCALRSDAPALFTSESTPRPRKRSSVHREPPTASDDGLDCNSPIARAKMDRLNSARLSVDCNGEVFGELKRLDLSVLRQAYRRGRGVMLAIDWDPTALHLRYQSTREKAFIEHPSVSQCLAEAAKPIDLGSCLTAFTSEELLEARYQCAKCAGRQPATKKLQIWRAPPIMIIHLKRFQYMNNKWIKSQKVVNFPLQDFDPSEYLAAVPQETLRRYKEISRRRSSMFIDETISESEEDSDTESDLEPKTEDHHSRPAERTRINTRRERIQSTSLAATPVTDDNLIDYHQHHLLRNQNAFDLKYRLYAVVSHSGQLSGGHYVAYARNPSGAWLCYNDSSCRALPAPRLDPAAAYLLFYERQQLDTDKYLPEVSNREPVIKDTDTLDPDEADLKKCVIQ